MNSHPMVCGLGLSENSVSVVLRIEAGRRLVIPSWRAPVAAPGLALLLVPGLVLRPETLGEAAHPHHLLLTHSHLLPRPLLRPETAQAEQQHG